MKLFKKHYFSAVFLLLVSCSQMKESSGDSEELRRQTNSPNKIGEGSGTWGSLRKQINDRDRFYHASWKVIAKAASLKFPIASRNMEHYLKGYGNDIVLTPSELNKIEQDADFNSCFKELGNDLIQPKINLKLSEISTKSLQKGLAVLEHWQMGCAATQYTDLGWALGGAIFGLSVKGNIQSLDDNKLVINAEVFKSIRDNYNWDLGKSVTMFDNWCLEGFCRGLQDITTLQIDDKDLGRLHKVGLAREYKIRGMWPLKTYKWEVTRNELKTKKSIWKDLIENRERPEAPKPPLPPVKVKK